MVRVPQVMKWAREMRLKVFNKTSLGGAARTASHDIGAIYEIENGACAHYNMVSNFQWKPFWLATQRDAQNDWTATQNSVNYDVFAQAPMTFFNKL